MKGIVNHDRFWVRTHYLERGGLLLENVSKPLQTRARSIEDYAIAKDLIKIDERFQVGDRLIYVRDNIGPDYIKRQHLDNEPVIVKEFVPIGF